MFQQFKWESLGNLRSLPIQFNPIYKNKKVGARGRRGITNIFLSVSGEACKEALCSQDLALGCHHTEEFKRVFLDAGGWGPSQVRGNQGHTETASVREEPVETTAQQDDFLTGALASRARAAPPNYWDASELCLPTLLWKCLHRKGLSDSIQILAQLKQLTVYWCSANCSTEH